MKYFAIVFYIGLLSTLFIGCGGETQSTQNQGTTSSNTATNSGTNISKLRTTSNDILGIWY